MKAANAQGASLANNRAASFVTNPTVKDTVLFWKAIYTASGVQKIPMPSSYKVYSNGGNLVVEGVKSSVAVYDLLGRELQSSKLSGTFVSSALKTGIYIVRFDEFTRKVLVRQ